MLGDYDFPQISNMTLIKSLLKSNQINMWENMEIYKHHHNNTVIKEDTEKTKQDEIFKTLKFIKRQM